MIPDSLVEEVGSLLSKVSSWSFVNGKNRRKSTSTRIRLVKVHVDFQIRYEGLETEKRSDYCML